MAAKSRVTSSIKKILEKYTEGKGRRKEINKHRLKNQEKNENQGKDEQQDKDENQGMDDPDLVEPGESSKNKFSCTICDKKFDRSKSLKFHQGKRET